MASSSSYCSSSSSQEQPPDFETKFRPGNDCYPLFQEQHALYLWNITEMDLDDHP